jgi:ketosteroid isomerase-like protein
MPNGTSKALAPGKLDSTMPMRAVDLARQFFDALATKDVDGVLVLLHPEVTIAPRIFKGTMFHGLDEARTFYEDVLSWDVYEPLAGTFHPITDDTVVIEGHVVWQRRNGQPPEDTAAVWLFVFKNALLRNLTGYLALESTLAEARQHVGPGRGYEPS